MKNLDLNHDNYVYQVDYEDLSVSIFAGVDKVPEKKEFELSAHADVYERVKNLMKSSVKMDGTDWNNQYKVWESLTFWDDKGESTTVPICGAKLGVYKSLSHDELKEVLELLEYLEKEDEECRNKPSEPVVLNFIDSNGISRQGTIVPAHDPATPNRNHRVYSREAIEAAVKNYEDKGKDNKVVVASSEVNFTGILGESLTQTELREAMVSAFGTMGTGYR